MPDENKISTTSEEIEVYGSKAWRTRNLIIGGVAGAVVGVLAGYLISQKAEDEKPPQFTPVEGVKIGVLIFGLLRSIANL